MCMGVDEVAVSIIADMDVDEVAINELSSPDVSIN